MLEIILITGILQIAVGMDNEVFVTDKIKYPVIGMNHLQTMTSSKFDSHSVLIHMLKIRP